jgi:L-lactate dehydrogenase complex protein LldF
VSENPILHRDLLNNGPAEGVTRGDKRLDHAEGTSTPMRPKPEPQPRGARIRGNRPVDQSEAADRFIASPAHLKMHDERLWNLRQKRDREMRAIPEWEELRDLASAIKEHTLTHLDVYLDQFETNARANGVQVHWARDAAEHNRIVLGILQSHGAKRLIKSKAMLTEECDFRQFMSEHGVEIVETDLGERIQQLDGEAPSHVVVPAVHKLRSDVARVFAEKLGSDPDTQDVHYLAETMREATRPLITSADTGMTGCNFAVAETGAIVVSTNEGNADLSANTPPLHIVSVFISSPSASRRSSRGSTISPYSCDSCREAPLALR